MQGQLSALPPPTNTQCYLLSHFKGCFIPAKSQSSPARPDSGLGFTSELSVLTPARTSRGAGCGLSTTPCRGTAVPAPSAGRHRARGCRPGETRRGSGAARSRGAKQCCFLGRFHYGFLWVTNKTLLACFSITRLTSAAGAFPVPLRNPTLSVGTAAPIQPTQHLQLLCYSPSC